MPRSNTAPLCAVDWCNNHPLKGDTKCWTHSDNVKKCNYGNRAWQCSKPAMEGSDKCYNHIELVKNSKQHNNCRRKLRKIEIRFLAVERQNEILLALLARIYKQTTGFNEKMTSLLQDAGQAILLAENEAIKDEAVLEDVEDLNAD